ncbi:hypothetical protein M885DRAFT_549191 [Pelagophyceae sp. CCMP2097]|nr:hypothetical protein M885DRAFT_549191 [Pelagophyceae sp. CCMP2097]
MMRRKSMLRRIRESKEDDGYASAVEEVDLILECSPPPDHRSKKLGGSVASARAAEVAAVPSLYLDVCEDGAESPHDARDIGSPLSPHSEVEVEVCAHPFPLVAAVIKLWPSTSVEVVFDSDDGAPTTRTTAPSPETARRRAARIDLEVSREDSAASLHVVEEPDADADARGPYWPPPLDQDPSPPHGAGAALDARSAEVRRRPPALRGGGAAAPPSPAPRSASAPTGPGPRASLAHEDEAAAALAARTDSHGLSHQSSSSERQPDDVLSARQPDDVLSAYARGVLDAIELNRAHEGRRKDALVKPKKREPKATQATKLPSPPRGRDMRRNTAVVLKKKKKRRPQVDGDDRTLEASISRGSLEASISRGSSTVSMTFVCDDDDDDFAADADADAAAAVAAAAKLHAAIATGAAVVRRRRAVTGVVSAACFACMLLIVARVVVNASLRPPPPPPEPPRPAPAALGGLHPLGPALSMDRTTRQPRQPLQPKLAHGRDNADARP